MINKPQNGFTLIEILVSMFLVLPMLMILVDLVPVQIRMDRKADNMTKNVTLAVMKMEEIRSQVNSTDKRLGYQKNYSQTAAKFSKPNITYKYTVKDSHHPQLKNVSVTVWNDQNNNSFIDSNEESYALFTQIANLK
ncbi:MAG: prepilin-type N-terminal cleavage/methylation domain-containing protein [Candidatus Margulisbacteria bacterium]|nr:prepilin-type N-terminal cleavage/methylation domain-containing protein [Candidatus Margulisiibacteriota bacterium]